MTITTQQYLGQVATNCHVPNLQNVGAKGFQARSRHVMKDDVSQLQVAFANWNVKTGTGGNGIENTLGGAARIIASIEYPIGTCRQLMFSGVMTGSAADGATLLSDPCDIDIPRGAAFFVRTNYYNPAGIVWHDGQDANQGEAFHYDTAAVTDQTRGGTIVDAQGNAAQGNTYNYRPCAIIAQTTRKSAFVVGDSKAYGSGDSYANDTASARGSIQRSLADNMASINVAVSGDRASWFNANSARRRALAQYCTDVICNYGINDLRDAGMTAAQVQSALQTLFGLPGISGKPILLTTLEPVTTSSDSWATTSGQTKQGIEPQRTALNNAIRNGIGQTSTIDIADVFETARNSGLWKVGQPDGAFTADGIHPSFAGTKFFKNQAHISSALF